MAFTTSGLLNAFVYGLCSAVAVALVAGIVAVIKWLGRLDRRLDGIDTSLGTIDLRFTEHNIRTANIEREMFENGGSSLRDAVVRIEARQASLYKRLGETLD